MKRLIFLILISSISILIAADPDPFIWNKLNSTTNSEVGSNITYAGSPTFSTCKFGNGYLYNSYVNAGRIPISTASNSISFSFWAKHNFNYGDLQPWILFRDNPGDLQFNWLDDLSIIISFNGAGGQNYAYFTVPAPLQWTVGDLVHYGISCNLTTGTMYVKLNNSELTLASHIFLESQYNLSYSPTFIPFDYPDDVYIPDMIVDNLKIYDYFKTDFSWDMANEGLESLFISSRKIKRKKIN